MCCLLIVVDRIALFVAFLFVVGCVWMLIDLCLRFLGLLILLLVV